MRLLMTESSNIREVDVEADIYKLTRHLDMESKRLKKLGENGHVTVKSFDEEGTLTGEKILTFPLQVSIEEELDEFFDLMKPAKKAKRGLFGRKKDRKAKPKFQEVVESKTEFETVVAQPEPIVQEIRTKPCVNCGRYVDENMKFCQFCGADQEVPAKDETYFSPIENEQDLEAELEAEFGHNRDDDAEETVRIVVQPESRDQSEVVSAVEVKPEFTIVCIHCGALIPQGSKFCLNCGQLQEVNPKVEEVEMEDAQASFFANTVPEEVEQVTTVDPKTASAITAEPILEAPQDVTELFTKLQETALKGFADHSAIARQINAKYAADRKQKIEEKEAFIKKERDVALYEAKVEYEAAQKSINDKFDRSLQLQTKGINQEIDEKIASEVDANIASQNERIVNLGQSFIASMIGFLGKR